MCLFYFLKVRHILEDKNGKQRFVIEEQQVVLHMLLGIESVLAKMPNVSTDKKLQREIFKIALPYYRKCRLLDNTFSISNFETYLQDYVHEQFEKSFKLILSKVP